MQRKQGPPLWAYTVSCESREGVGDQAVKVQKAKGATEW